MLDPALLKFADTKKERQAFEAVIKYGNQEEAAEALGVTRNAVGKSIRRIKKKHWNGSARDIPVF